MTTTVARNSMPIGFPTRLGKCPSIGCLTVSLGLFIWGYSSHSRGAEVADSSPSAALEDARSCLLQSDVWIGSRMYGFSGEQTNLYARALDVLVRSPKARTILSDLLRSPKLVVQLYALCGLYHVDRATFRRSVEMLIANTNLVPIVSADTTGMRRVCDIVSTPYGNQKGEARVVLHEKQTLSEWLAELPPDTRPYMDISGGGIPSQLVDTPPQETDSGGIGGSP